VRGDTLDVGTIAASIPFLENLSGHDIFSFFGSLEQLSHLQILRLPALEIARRIGRPWLPLRSAETLIEVSLKCAPDVMPFFDTDSLGIFVNLKSLSIEPLTERSCEFIIRSRIQLDVLRITLLWPYSPIHKVFDMLRADCLRNLKYLRLSEFFDDRSGFRALQQY
jgi:hypothetical protein